MSPFSMRLFSASDYIAIASSAILRAGDAALAKSKATIRRVLVEESQREVNRREELSVLRTDSSAAPETYWQSGFVKTQGQWTPAEDVDLLPVS